MTKIQTSRQRGKELENFIADKLKSSGLDLQAIRQIGSGSGLRKGDVHNSLGWTFEAKNTKRFDFYEAAKQVEREAMGYQKSVIVWHPKNRPLENSVAIINFEDFITLLKSEKHNQSSDEILDKYSIKSNLEKGIFFLKKVVKNL